MIPEELTELRERLERAIEDGGPEVAEHADAVRQAATPYVALRKLWEPSKDPSFIKRLRREEGGYRAAEEVRLELSHERISTHDLGKTRLGGWPDLPPDLEWPRVTGHTTDEAKAEGRPYWYGLRMPFLAQIECAALPHWPGTPLPTSGFLFVFLFLSNDADSECRVLHHAGSRESLRRDACELDANDAAADWCGNKVYDLIEVEPMLGAWLDTEVLGAALGVAATTESVAVEDPIERDELVRRWDAGERPQGVELHRYANGKKVDVWKQVPRKSQAARKSDIPREFSDLGDTLRARGNLVGHLLGDTAWEETANEIASLDWGHNRTEQDWMNLLQLDSVGSFLWSDSGQLNLIIRHDPLALGDFGDVLHWVSSS